MRVLITGGAGFIGSNLADAFLARGDSVVVLDDLSTGSKSNLSDRAELVVLDIRSPEVAAVFERFRPDVLCHQAAQMDIGRSVADPAYDADVNITGTVRLLELCRTVGTRRVLFATTAGVYGEPEAFPTPESHPLNPVSPYGIGKLTVERYLHFYRLAYGFAPTCLRYANVYGPRQNAQGEGGVVAIFSRLLLNDQAVTIYGDGEQTRDFVYVGDVVQANLHALDHDAVGIFNVGTGIETTVNELYSQMRSLAGATAEARYAAARAGETRRSSLDSAQLKRATGWQPETPLSDGLRQTLAHFRGR